MPVPNPSIASSTSTSLSITNPLVLYRTLLATNRLKPDPAQHRLALQLQKLYFRLKDYRPEVEYRRQLDRVTRGLSSSSTTARRASNENGTKQGQQPPSSSPAPGSSNATSIRPKTSFLASLLSPKATADMKALLPSTPLHDTALTISSPQGMLLYGEVGRGKSMLLDMLFNALPSDRKRRWHFSTFMLDVFRRLEVERLARLSHSHSHSRSRDPGGAVAQLEHEHVVLALARETVETSPVLFLDEFQMPDRASSRLVNGFLTGFFGLGGVLVASSNRMPEELSKGVGVRFVDSHMPSGGGGIGKGKWGRGGWMGSFGLGSGGQERRKQDETERFVDVLKARCEVWEMEGQKDWRRELDDAEALAAAVAEEVELDLEKEQPVLMASTTETDVATTEEAATPSTPKSADSPPHYHLSGLEDPSLQADVARLNPSGEWKPFSLTIYGRTLTFPQTFFPSSSTPATLNNSTNSIGGVLLTPFSPLLTTPHGPADFVSLASHFHSVILTDVPILTSSTKNEARRLIWLIDALYEAGCRLVVGAEAPVGGLFFPETRRRLVRDSEEGRLLESGDVDGKANDRRRSYESDSIESEAFSEMYQDSIAPFRANVSSYDPKAEWRSADPTFAPVSQQQQQQQQRMDRARNVLADEDADFGPTYGNGRGHGMSTSQEGLQDILRRQGLDDGPATGLGTIGMRPDFTDTRVLVGEDERFAYKRARSRLWEMCGNRWWRERAGTDTDDDVAGWWRPEGGNVAGQTARFWEGAAAAAAAVSASHAQGAGGEQPDGFSKEMQSEEVDEKARQGSHDGGSRRNVQAGEGLFRHGASPYRTSEEAPPKFGWQHAWGMMSWGKKAGEWGKGVEGDRSKERREGKED